jgi:putative sterol carrier protein
MALPMAPMTDRISYEDLYARWEKGNWSATEIDFGVDREQWQADFTEFERKAAIWNYCLFFWGEDAVADNLAPFIDAAPLEWQKYFLATQQVDEARHAVFFTRFMHEVCGIGDGTPASGLSEVRPQLTWGFRKIFDRLDTMADELRRDRSIPTLAKAIALYHLIIEASLAQPGQHFITSYLSQREMLPGFRSGMEKVATDEQRHIAFGVKLLADLHALDPEVEPAVAELLREVIMWTPAVLTPPGWDTNYVEVFGYTLADLGEQGASSLETKLRAAGMPLEELPGPRVLPLDGSPRERAERGFKMLRAGILGEKNGPARRDRETLELLFDTIRNRVAPDHGLDRATTIQWDFRDAEPWSLRIQNGSARVEPGLAEDADLTLRCRYDDWVDVVGGRTDPRRLLLTGRLRPRGSLRLLAKLPQIFPA